MAGKRVKQIVTFIGTGLAQLLAVGHNRVEPFSKILFSSDLTLIFTTGCKECQTVQQSLLDLNSGPGLLKVGPNLIPRCQF